MLKKKGWIEKEFEKDGIAVRWVQSHGSNKALEFLNAGAVDFGSSAGAAALLAKTNGSPIQAIHAFPASTGSSSKWRASTAIRPRP